MPQISNAFRIVLPVCILFVVVIAVGVDTYSSLTVLSIKINLYLKLNRGDSPGNDTDQAPK
jgi:hypothetical protein